ncbi:hypothetical protein MGG_09617 [Pyricularia oryzae 70-15]|uniref:Lysine-specific metallo-endopeptidase domain-containing protein n=1 Tax=Pyricularia oryzae (strain 70-15 / ATCC MYA-4617 / FGSC 8958) TaxID=242507 RepID=G4NL84_PYRO7|nr:uncharacterized protein MGG_09617 [Pyricularia oryzae 70-15]EHA46729.1 hypothetical protein MGG_09617 [Pyricularia oryzae 70-15]
MADKAYYAANKNGSLFRRFFKTNDPDDAVASEGGSCTPDSTHAYVHDKQEMYICPYFFEHDLTERASTLIHELTHHKDIKGTFDYDTYKYDGIMGLTSEQNLMHADTYSIFAVYATNTYSSDSE